MNHYRKCTTLTSPFQENVEESYWEERHVQRFWVLLKIADLLLDKSVYYFSIHYNIVE